MAVYHHSFIAKEGWTLLFLIFCIAAVSSYFFFFLSIPVWMLFFLVLFLLRDPHRVIPAKPLAIVSPIQGVVNSVEPFYDPYLKREASKIVIKMRWYDVFSLRSPLEGQIKQSWLVSNDKGGKIKNVFWLQSDEHDDIVCSIGGGFLWWKPDCKINMGERIGQGQRCGFMHFGTIVELILPAMAHIEVKKGDRITSGESIVANLIHNK